ncbi:hypothetical protein J6590_101701, partial [Homalodisca vitripennis]
VVRFYGEAVIMKIGNCVLSDTRSPVRLDNRAGRLGSTLASSRYGRNYSQTVM